MYEHRDPDFASGRRSADAFVFCALYLQIDYAIYWILFSAALVVLGVFPGIATWAADLLEFQSPANLVYLVILFALILKLFTNTLKISKLNQQMSELAQHIALAEQQDAEG